jgi:hypothetical protein
MKLTLELDKALYGRDIRVHLNDGSVFEGKWDGYISDVDNEPDGESILLEREGGCLVELFTAAIVSIEPMNDEEEFDDSEKAVA